MKREKTFEVVGMAGAKALRQKYVFHLIKELTRGNSMTGVQEAR